MREKQKTCSTLPTAKSTVMHQNVFSSMFFWPKNEQCLIKVDSLHLGLIYSAATSKPEVGAKDIFNFPLFFPSWSAVRYRCFVRNTPTWQQVPGSGERLNS